MQKKIYLLIILTTILFTLVSCTKKKYIVIFKNYDDTILEEIYVIKGETAIYTKDTPIRLDDKDYSYHFNGWDLPLTNVQQDLVVYAQYESTPHTKFMITFDSCGGTSIESAFVPIGKTINQPIDPIKNGYDLSGWYTNANYENQWNFESDVVTENINLYAKWDIKNYQIDFFYDGGYGENNIDNYTIETETFNLFPAEKEGYTFMYWEDQFGNVVNKIEKGSYGDLQLQAIYIINIYVYVFYDSDGINIIKREEAEYGSQIIPPIAPQKEGYKFIGWSPDFVEGTILTESFTSYTAVYEEDPFNYIIVDNEAKITGLRNKGSTELDIPSTINGYNVTTIGSWAFNNCDNLKIVTIPETITIIEDYVFFNCTSLEEISIPKTVQTLGKWAFSGCNNLKTIDIPENITSIGEYAFNNCYNLEKIVIPDNVTEIANSAFYNCTSLVEITIPFVGNKLNGIVNTHLGYIFGANIYEDNYNYIPNSLKKVSVTNSAPKDFAFYDCQNIEEILIPDSTTNIAQYMFYNCIKLSVMNIPKHITQIQNFSFYNCRSLENIIIPSNVTSIGYSVFNGCNQLLNVTLPTGILNVSDYAFANCVNLEVVTINGDVVTIGNAAFLNCRNLQSITLPSTVEEIGNYAFYECNKLESIELGKKLIKIGSYAFGYCTNLKILNLPLSVCEIESYAFYNCYAIESIVIPEGVTSLNTGTFANCFALKEVIIPKSILFIDIDIFINTKSLNQIKYKGSKLDWENIEIDLELSEILLLEIIYNY